MDEVGCQHRADETDGAEYADGRELLHGVHAFDGHRVVGHGVHEGDGGHEEGDAQAVQDEQGCELDGRAGAHAVEAGPGHEEAGEAVAQGKDPLGFHFLVGDDAHQRGHENGDDALHGEEPLDLAPETDVAQIASQGGEVGPPDGKLQEQHQNELEGYGFDFHFGVWFDYRFRNTITQKYEKIRNFDRLKENRCSRSSSQPGIPGPPPARA